MRRWLWVTFAVAALAVGGLLILQPHPQHLPTLTNAQILGAGTAATSPAASAQDRADLRDAKSRGLTDRQIELAAAAIKAGG